MKHELALIPLFEAFVKENYKGKRLKQNGQRLSLGTASNYANTLKLLKAFELNSGFSLRVSTKFPPSRAMKETKYWKRFYHLFSTFLYKREKCFDNYVGSVMKTVRVFLGYLQREKGLPTERFQRLIFVRKEEVDIITLDIDQLNFLIGCRSFHQSLPPHLQNTKNIFLFGCATALRYSDLKKLRVSQVSSLYNGVYLSVKSQKTGAVSKVKLPQFAIEIVKLYSTNKKGHNTIFPLICLRQFNKNLQVIAEKAGWTYSMLKYRQKNGKLLELFKSRNPSARFRFCDLVSSHIMRRTAITTMLMKGVPEVIVRQISGHSSASPAFYRYVKFTQPYLDHELDRLHQSFSNFHSVELTEL